ncbi:hypothetical protein AB6A40_002767 [Gnathostoma spinigerum]|uniref:Uncharacterized protein n=1 Tax=Gnathostoma spinigerum TaxID=75299 RepID=A0ABD6E7I9_9BILA
MPFQQPLGSRSASLPDSRRVVYEPYMQKGTSEMLPEPQAIEVMSAEQPMTVIDETFVNYDGIWRLAGEDGQVPDFSFGITSDTVSDVTFASDG